MFMFEKYQKAILGPSSSDSVATLEKKFGKTFFWVQNKINLGEKTEEITLV